MAIQKMYYRILELTYLMSTRISRYITCVCMCLCEVADVYVFGEQVLVNDKKQIKIRTQIKEGKIRIRTQKKERKIRTQKCFIHTSMYQRRYMYDCKSVVSVHFYAITIRVSVDSMYGWRRIAH